MNTTIDTKRINENVNLIDLAGGYTTLRRESATEMAGPCPKCGGDDRLHVKRDTFFCRQCYPLGNGSHDAIGFMRWLRGLSFVDACQALTGGRLPVATGQPVTPKREGKAVERSETWQKDAQKLVKNAQRLLLGSQVVQTELERRGLGAQACEAWGVGAVMRPHPALGKSMPAIVVPWLEADGETVQAVQFRFVGVTKDQGRFTQLKGGERRLFGLHRLRGKPVLVVCEGELNAVSIWQEKPGVDAVSFGPEDNTRGQTLDDLTRLAGDYQHVIVWADKPGIAKELQAAIPGAFGFFSELHGEKVDANDWLHRGKLASLLTGLLEKMTGSNQQPTDTPPGVLGYYRTFAEGWAAYQAASAEGRGVSFSRTGAGHGLFILREGNENEDTTKTTKTTADSTPTDSDGTGGGRWGAR